MVLSVDVQCDDISSVGALAFFVHQEVATLLNLWSGDKCYSAFPAAGSDPEFGLRMEELDLGNFIFDFYRLYVGIVVN